MSINTTEVDPHSHSLHMVAKPKNMHPLIDFLVTDLQLINVHSLLKFSYMFKPRSL